VEASDSESRAQWAVASQVLIRGVGSQAPTDKKKKGKWGRERREIDERTWTDD
jgi:hypothetical protein